MGKCSGVKSIREKEREITSFIFKGTHTHVTRNREKKLERYSLLRTLNAKMAQNDNNDDKLNLMQCNSIYKHICTCSPKIHVHEHFLTCI